MKILKGLTQWALVPLWPTTKTILHKHKMSQTTLRRNTIFFQGINPMGLCAPWDDTYLHNCKLEELWMITLMPINILMITGEIKNHYPHHDLPQTCVGRKHSCPVCIRPTENFLTYPKKSSSINGLWPNKWNTNK